MTSSTSEDKKSRRINFSPDTKLELAKRAGFHCSYPTCLVPTTGPTVDDEGNDSAAGIAIAAHIYPASKNGPRKRDGLTPEQIRNISNGIWLCRTHGTLIDDFQDEFPAEKVIEMKKVREFAQWLSLKLPDVAFFVGFIGVKRLDAIVWKHWPKPDEEKIRVDVISEVSNARQSLTIPSGPRCPSRLLSLISSRYPERPAPGPCILLLYLRRLGVNRSLQNAAAQSTLSPPGESMRSAGVGMGKGFLSTIAM